MTRSQVMVLDFYKLREQPFGVSPDPRFLYLSAKHREALASLFYGVESGLGFMALIAPPGMGKTTLLFHLLEQLRTTARTAFLFETRCDSHQLLLQLLADLNVEGDFGDDATGQQRLNEFLVGEAKAGRRVVVIIDEAHNLDEKVMEWVCLLSNFETPSRKLLQIILSGQPSLAEKLAAPDLAQLRQRISILGRLGPFTRSECSHYVDHRLRVAGYRGRGLFERDALALIAARSEGIPRIINRLCFNALSLGYAQEQKKVHASIVEEVLSDLDLRKALDPRPLDHAESASLLAARADDSCPPERREGAKPRFYGSNESIAVSTAANLQLSGHCDGRRYDVRPAAGQDTGLRRWILPAALVFCLVFLGAFFWMMSYGGEPHIARASASSKATRPTAAAVVQPNETVAKISEHYLGRFDKHIAREIRKLDLRLAGLNPIEGGQKIRLPGGMPFASGPNQHSATTAGTLVQGVR